MKNHYDTLNVSLNATKDEIKKSYRSLSLRYHPDLNRHSSAERFKQISEAYTILSNEKQRKLYDFELAEWRRFGRISSRRNSQSGSSSYTSANSHGPFHRPSSTAMAYHLHVLEGIFKPKNAFIGLTLGFITVSAIRSIHSYYSSLQEQQDPQFQKLRNNRDGTKKYVEAWYNEQTRSWETPAVSLFVMNRILPHSPLSFYNIQMFVS